MSLMKTFLVILFSLILFSLKAQKNPYMSIDAGYVTDHHVQLSMYTGIQAGKASQVMKYLMEAGATLQVTNAQVLDIASLNLGAEFHAGNFFTMIKVGPAYCFNLPTKDRYKPNDTTEMIFSDGAEKSTCFSWLGCVRVGYETNKAPLYIQITYAGKLIWFGAGIKILFGQ